MARSSSHEPSLEWTIADSKPMSMEPEDRLDEAGGALAHRTRGISGLGHAFAHRRKFLGAEADLDLVDFYVMRVEC